MFRLVEVFNTIQGEGFNCGKSALFIRMPFCNYNCSWCDTEYNKYEEFSSTDLHDFIDRQKNKFAVITGGEPLMNKQTPDIIELLKNHKFTIAIESNGSFPRLDGVDWLTVSPKKQVQKGLPEYFINPSLKGKINELKYVVDDNFDFGILKRHQEDNCLKYLSPEFGNFKTNIEKIILFVMENPEWKISLQTHKWMNVR